MNINKIIGLIHQVKMLKEKDNKQIIIFIFFLGLFCSCAGQNDSSGYSMPINNSVLIVEEKIFTIVEEMPSFPGGESEFLKFIKNEIKITTQDVSESKFNITFIIDKEGRLSDIQVNNKYEDEDVTQTEIEVFRVIKLMPKWIPGKHEDKNVSVKMSLPLNIDVSRW